MKADRVRTISLLAGVALLLGVPGGTSAKAPDDPSRARTEMVRAQIEARGIKNPRVLAVMRDVPRHAFVPMAQRASAYEDRPLPIGLGQTISQPYIVALMTELLDPKPTDSVLEVGTGSGYQAAVLSRLVRRVTSIEILPELAERARQDLARNGFANVTVFTGDGYLGRPELAPFDSVIVTAAPDHLPEPLLTQLRVGGRLVMPVGDRQQTLKVFEKTPGGVKSRDIIPVRFVPMTGEAEKRPREE